MHVVGSFTGRSPRSAVCPAGRGITERGRRRAEKAPRAGGALCRSCRSPRSRRARTRESPSCPARPHVHHRARLGNMCTAPRPWQPISVTCVLPNASPCSGRSPCRRRTRPFLADVAVLERDRERLLGGAGHVGAGHGERAPDDLALLVDHDRFRLDPTSTPLRMPCGISSLRRCRRRPGCGAIRGLRRTRVDAVLELASRPRGGPSCRTDEQAVHVARRHERAPAVGLSGGRGAAALTGGYTTPSTAKSSTIFTSAFVWKNMLSIASLTPVSRPSASDSERVGGELVLEAEVRAARGEPATGTSSSRTCRRARWNSSVKRRKIG